MLLFITIQALSILIIFLFFLFFLLFCFAKMSLANPGEQLKKSLACQQDLLAIGNRSSVNEKTVRGGYLFYVLFLLALLPRPGSAADYDRNVSISKTLPSYKNQHFFQSDVQMKFFRPRLSSPLSMFMGNHFLLPKAFNSTFS